MSSFTEGLQLELLPDGKTFELLKPFYFYFVEGINEGVTVPAGFQTDFASIPRLFTPLIQKMGKHSKASVLHDYLYSEPKFRSRKECDMIFLDALKAAGVSKVKRMAMYYGARIGGAKHYRGIE